MQQRQVALRDVVEDGVQFAVESGHVPAEEQQILSALLTTADDARIVRRLRRRRNGDPLGFNLGEAVGVLGPALMMALEESYRTVVAGATGVLLGTWLQRLFRREPVVTSLHELPRERLRAVHDLMLDKLVEAGISDDTARVVAERVVGCLALGREAVAEGEADTAHDARGDGDDGSDEQTSRT
jgi:hypothetical protein